MLGATGKRFEKWIYSHRGNDNCIYIMNANPSIVLLLMATVGLSAAPPPRIAIQPIAGEGVLLEAHDRENGSWILEHSPDGKLWTSLGPAAHVRNSVLPMAGGEALQTQSGRGFFRLASSPVVPERSLTHMLNLPATPHPYSEQSVAPGILARTVGAVTINNHRATLGRVLFHDRRLSRDNSVSCASCHVQDRAFAEEGAFSLGHLGVKTTRNTVSLTHVRNYSKTGAIFWDGRSSVLDSAVLDPITHPDEMGLTLETMVAKVAAEPYYAPLLVAAFDTNVPTQARVGTALADFIEAMTTFGSKYDQQSMHSFGNFTAQENAGKSLFTSKCASCHPLGNFTNGGFANNGLEMHYADRGRAALTGNPQHEGQFRIPSLRQVGLTAPYMHDGRFATLREVIDFYDHGVVAHPNLTAPLTGTIMELSENQKQALEAFLNTLTDASIQTRPEFSDPFRID